MNKIVITFMLLTFATPAFSIQDDEGLPGYFLNLGIGARALSLGRSYVAMSDDSSSVYWNQAGLSFLDRPEVSFTHISLFEDTQYNSFTFAQPVSSNLTCGLSLIQLYSGGIVKRDYYNTPLGTINDIKNALLLSFGYKVSKYLSLGLGGKKINIRFDDINNTWNALDCSAICSPSNKIRIGFNLQNIVFSSWDRGYGKYDVAMNSKIGIAYSPFLDKLIISADEDISERQGTKIHSGIEWNACKYLAFRGGYDNGNFATGAGFRLNDYILDYALLSHELGLSHRVTLSYRFNKSVFKERKISPDIKNNIVDKKDYEIHVDIMKEIPTAIYHLFQQRDMSVINVKIKNKIRENQRFKISYRIGLINPNETLEIIVPGEEEKTINIIPTLSREDIRKIEVMPTPSAIFVEISLIGKSDRSKSIFKEKYDILFLSYDQFTPQKTDAKGDKLDLLDTLINWVTFNDRSLIEVIAKASERGAKQFPPIKIVGFQSPNAFTRRPSDNRTMEESYKDCKAQVKLIYDVLKEDYRITYINQPISYMDSQRIKLPYETLTKKGNCIELATLFGSLLESVEIDPILVIVLQNKHAAIAFKVYGEGKEKYVMLETNVFGEEFEKVLTKGELLVAESSLQSEFADGVTFDKNGIYRKGDVLLFDIKRMRSNIPPSPYVPH